MVVLIALIAVLIIGLPTAVWFAIGAVRANRGRDLEPRAPEPTYGADETGKRGPNVLGTAWARETTFIE